MAIKPFGDSGALCEYNKTMASPGKKNIYMDVQEMFYMEFMKMDGLLETHPGQETIF